MTTARFKYMFSLKAALPTRMLGKTPAGYRFDVEYQSNQSPEAGQVRTDSIRVLRDWAQDLLEWLRLDPERLAAIKAKAPPGLENAIWAAITSGVKFGNQQGGQAVTVTDLLVGTCAPPTLPNVDWDRLAADLEEVETELQKPGATQAQLDFQREAVGLKKKQAEYDELEKKAATFLKLVSDHCAENATEHPWLGVKGYILSGVDWALLRRDGVIEFDGQLVLTDDRRPKDDRDDDQSVLVNARTSGAVDLVAKGYDRPYSLDHAFELWKMEATVPLALSFKFEAPQESEPWASKKYTRRKGQLRYAQLSRGQFVGCGELKTNAREAASVELDVFHVLTANKIQPVRPPDESAEVLKDALARLKKFQEGGRFE